mgnify:CR=1 FL=1
MPKTLKGPDSLVSAGDVVILIHGTFAKPATWVRDDSTLAKAIASRLPTHKIKPFRWSGRNTYGARIAAGKELAGLIDQWVTNLPLGAGLHLIGHSHGGNVALYAQAISRNNKKIKSIACLGTPFLHIEAHQIDDSVRLWVIVACLVIALMSVPVLIKVIITGHAVPEFLHMLGVTTDLGRIWIVIFAWTGLVYGLFDKNVNWRGKFERWLRGKLSGEALTFANRVQCEAPTQRLFIATTRGDEARIFLDIGSRMATIPKHAFAIIRASLWPAVITAIVLDRTFSVVADYIDFAFVNPDSYERNRDPLGAMDLIVFFPFVAFLIPFAMLLANLVFRSNPLVFGWENLASSLACGVRPVAVPDWIVGKEVTLHRTSAKKSGLRHSAFYDDPPTIDALVTWLAGDTLNLHTEQPNEVYESLPIVLRKRLAWTAVVITATYCIINAAQNLRVVGM